MPFLLVLASDHITGAAGLTPTVTISKDGAAFASPAGAVTELANGWYLLAGNATDRNTAGSFLLHATGTGTDPTDEFYTIVPWDPFDGNLALTGLNGLAAPAAAGGLITVGTGSGQANPDGTGAVPVAFGTALPTAGALVAGSVGEALFYADMVIGRRNTAQGGTATTITLDAGASAVDNAFKDHAAKLIGGTGSGQYATIIGYVGATKVATIWRPGTGNGWSTTPDNSTQYVTIPTPAVDVSFWAGTTVTGGLPNTVAPLTAAQVGTAVWTDTVGSDFTVTNSAGIGLAGLVTAVAGKLDATISGIPAAVWRDAVSGDFAVASSAGLKLMGLTGGTDPWATALPGAYGAGTAGFIVGTNLNATIASRMATFVYTAPPTAAAIAAAVLTDTTDTATAGSLGHLIGTAPSWYAAPPTPPTAAQNATAVWQDATAGDFTVGNSAGAKLVALATGVTVTANNDKTGYGLAATGLDAVVIETGLNLPQSQSLVLAACAGLISGAGTGTITIGGGNGGPTRMVATVDASGNRSAITYTIPSI